MKNSIKLFLLLALSTSIISCLQSPKGKKTEAKQAKEIVKSTAKKLGLDLEKSHIVWSGTKPGGEHSGTVMLKDSYVEINKENITGGKFIIDLNSINNTDVEDEEMNTKLVNHLKSEDFFHIEKHPTAVFEISEIEKLTNEEIFSHKVSGNLRIKDSVKNISFMAKIIIHEGHLTAESEQFKIDRTKWGINFGSKKIFAELKDKFIHDEMGLIINIETREEKEKHEKNH